MLFVFLHVGLEGRFILSILVCAETGERKLLAVTMPDCSIHLSSFNMRLRATVERLLVHTIYNYRKTKPRKCCNGYSAREHPQPEVHGRGNKKAMIATETPATFLILASGPNKRSMYRRPKLVSMMLVIKLLPITSQLIIDCGSLFFSRTMACP